MSLKISYYDDPARIVAEDTIREFDHSISVLYSKRDKCYEILHIITDYFNKTLISDNIKFVVDIGDVFNEHSMYIAALVTIFDVIYKLNDPLVYVSRITDEFKKKMKSTGYFIDIINM